MKRGFFDAFARLAGIFAIQSLLQQLVWILMCIVIGIFLMVACYIALKHFYNREGWCGGLNKAPTRLNKALTRLDKVPTRLNKAQQGLK